MNVLWSVGRGETSGDREERDDSAVIALVAVSCISGRIQRWNGCYRLTVASLSPS